MTRKLLYQSPEVETIIIGVEMGFANTGDVWPYSDIDDTEGNWNKHSI